MRLNILVVEDDPIDLISIKAKLRELGHHDPIIADHTADFMYLFKTTIPQLVISDIYYDHKPAGLALINICRNQNIPLILMTADTRFDTYNLASKEDNVSYLVKPFHHFTLQSCIDMLMKNFVSTPATDDKYIFINDHTNKKEKLNYRDILFLQSEGNSCHIHCTNNQYSIRMALAKLSTELGNDFVQVHKSFMVNREHIDKVSTNNLTIGEHEIPVGRKYRKDLFEMLPSIKK